MYEIDAVAPSVADVPQLVHNALTDIGQVGDARLLVMVSLLLADELSDAYAELKVARTNDGAAARLDREENLTVALESVAQRIETIAESLERT